MAPVSRLVSAIRIKKTVASSATVTIDTVSLDEFVGAKYFVSVTGNSRSRTLELSVVDDNGALKDSVSARLGSGISFSIDTNIVGSDMVVSVTNNAAFSVDVEVLKFLTGIL